MHTNVTPHRRRARRIAAAGTLAVTGILAAGTVAAGPATASSHREAPGIAGTPKLDATDLYAFLSPDKAGTVTLVANWQPFSEPAGGPNFYTFDDDARYELAVDTDGDAKEDVVYRWNFKTHVRDGNTFLYNTGPVKSLSDKTLNVFQTYDLQEFRRGRWWTIKHDGIVAPSNVGKASMPDYASLRHQAIYSAGHKDVFAGQADDPFFADLRVFDLLYGGDLSESGNDTLAGYNVNTTAIRVPVDELGGHRNVIGVWSRALKKDSRGDYRQVSRLGNPLVNEVVIGIKDKDKFNASSPAKDAQFLDFVTKPGLPKVIEQVFKIKAPAEPRNDLVQVFLTGVPGLNQQVKVTPSEELRLNLSPFYGQKANRLGVIGGDKNGFPNGRRLTDDVIDASLQVVEGELVGSPNDLTDKVDANDVAFQASFPYVGLPTSGSTSVNSVRAGGAGAGYGAGYGAMPTADRVAYTASSVGGSSQPVVALAALAGLGLLGGSGAWFMRRRRPAAVRTRG